jgi:hypothetical protein
LETASSASKVISSLSVFVAVIWLGEALKQVWPETVEQCFYKTKLSVSNFCEKKQTNTSRLFTYHLVRLRLKMLWEHMMLTLKLQLLLKKEMSLLNTISKPLTEGERESAYACMLASVQKSEWLWV